MATFEGYERREAKILSVLKEYGINSIDECKTICEEKGIDPYTIVQETQPICFENAKWAYTVGCAIAIKMGCTKAADAAAAIGIGLQAFCIPGSVAENRKVGLGHGNLGKMLLSEETECFAFLAGHESFAAAEGAIKIALNANKVRTKPLRVILNGLGKDAAFIISRINGFTYVETEFDPYAEEVKVVSEKAYSNGPRADVKCYGADNVPEGVIVLVAVFADMATVDLAVANDHELDIKSTMMYRHEDYVGAIELVEAGKVQLKPLISKIFPFAQYLDAYKYIDANRETTMKVIIAVQEK